MLSGFVNLPWDVLLLPSHHQSLHLVSRWTNWSVSCFFSSDSSLTGGSGCDENTVPHKLLILDARSYTAAVANRAKGGGCECEGLSHQTFHRMFPYSGVSLFVSGSVTLSATEWDNRPSECLCSGIIILFRGTWNAASFRLFRICRKYYLGRCLCPVTYFWIFCLCSEYYPNCEVMFMGMANIHAIRNSFQALRTVCCQIPDPGK